MDHRPTETDSRSKVKSLNTDLIYKDLKEAVDDKAVY